MDTLDELALKHGTDKSSNEHGYTQIYPQYIEKYRHEPIHFFEIGVKRGRSVGLWRDYFTHPEAKLSALDINLTPIRRNLCHLLDSDHPRAAEMRPHRVRPMDTRWKLFEGNQRDPVILNEVIARGLFDVVIDDGSHRGVDQKESLDYLWPFVKPGGLYIIEDLQVSYIRTPEWNGNVNIIDHIKTTFIDRLLEVKKNEEAPLSYVHFYKRFVVLEK